MLKKIVPFAIIIISIFIALTAIEIGLRAFLPQKVYSSFLRGKNDCYTPDKILYAVHKQNATCYFITKEYDTKVSLNNLGLRSNHPTSLEKPTNTTRVLFLGDSFVFGQGVEDHEAFPSLTEKYLNATGSAKVETLNAGMIGSELTYEYLFLKSQGKKLSPDIVVVGFFLGNDLDDLSYFTWEEVDQEGFPGRITTKDEYVDSDGTRRMSTTPQRYKIPVLREFHVFILISEKIFGPIQPNQYITVNGTPCLLQPTCKDLDPDIAKAEMLLKGMKHLTSHNNQHLLVVIIPWDFQLPRDLLSRSGINFFATKSNRHYLGNRFSSFLEKENIDHLNLLDAFEEYKGDKQVFFPQDTHWTPEGHQIAAKAVADKLEKIMRERKSVNLVGE